MGPLSGIKVVELAGIGPGPFSGMMLSDLGAEVTLVDRVSAGAPKNGGSMERGKRSISVNLKDPEGVEVILDLIAESDVLLEGFRAGVTDRLGIGPDVALARNPKLVYARMTGWGQEGPMAHQAGHDINYISLAGPLAHIGRAGQPPTPPLNLVGDFGGGSLFCVLGICAALLNVSRGGEGQVVDSAMVDGASYLMSPMYAAHASGFWTDERGTNFLDSGAHFYDVYECSDGGFISVGAIEPQFYANLLAGLGLADADDLADQNDRSQWAAMSERFAAIFKTKTRDEWAEIFNEAEACTTPVLTMGETQVHPQAAARSAFFEAGGTPQPFPAPRFLNTPAEPATSSEPGAASTDAVLAELGRSPETITDLRQRGVVS